MNKQKIIRIGLPALIGILIIIQFFRPDHSAPAVIPAHDFIAVTQPPANLSAHLKAACYDCHSYETVWPWYTNIAPISWWISGHVKGGRQHLNFSEWGTFTPEEQAHQLEECHEVLEKKWMPLSSYTWLHPSAKLSETDRKLLSDWFNSL